MADELPQIFPIFPLNQVLLVPGGLLPLHIFEPRYQAMLADCLAGERMLAMASMTKRAVFGHPAVDPVLGLGRIIHSEAYPDGRSDIILEGLARMQIEEEIITDRPYRLVRARRLEEIEVVEDIEERLRLLIARVPGFDDKERVLYESLPLVCLLDSLLVRLPVPMQDKFEAFACADLLQRFEVLERAMEGLEEPPSSMGFGPGDPRLN